MEQHIITEDVRSEALTFLKKHATGTLATISPSGSPPRTHRVLRVR